MTFDSYSNSRVPPDNTRGSLPLPDYTTDTKSTVFEDRDGKLDFLDRYLDMPSEIIDTAYHIIYQDNSKDGFQVLQTIISGPPLQ